MKVARFIYIALKIIITIAGSFAMLLGIVFSLLSKDQLSKLIKEDFWSFFFTKFLIGIIIGFLFYLLSLLINLIFRKRHDFQKRTIKILAIIEIIYFILFSALVTTIIIHGI